MVGIAVAYAYENVGVDPTPSEGAAAYAYENVLAAGSTDAVAYIYMNVGVEIVDPSPDAVAYVYMNVGVAITENRDAVEYIYLNVDNAAEAIPHLWSVQPGAGAPGAEVLLYGTNLKAPTDPTGEATIAYFGVQPGWDGVEPIAPSNQMAVLVLPTLVAASANAYTSLRSIPASGAPNVEHQVMTVEVPIPAITSEIRVEIPEP